MHVTAIVMKTAETLMRLRLMVEPATPPIEKPRRARDVRLDFFRGLAMFIIFVAHMPDNSWFSFIPARFGFSSAGELFVFCSGLASAFAFGSVFNKAGFGAGLKRILVRIWQVYWAHIGLALGVITVSIAATSLTGIDYEKAVGLGLFYADPAAGFLGLVSLTYVPAFLDVLPMYLVLLAFIPVMMALAKISRYLAMGAILALWLAVQITGINLPGGYTAGAVWHFNPFAWGLIFFTAFAFGLGWLPRPALVKGRLFWACVAFLVVSVPVNFWAFTDNVPVLEAIHEGLVGPTGKTNLNILLYLHFLASAYVALVLIDPVKHRLAEARPIILVGQQALASFIASILLAWMGGMLLDQIGRGVLATAFANLAGFAGILVVAALTQAYKRVKEPEKAAAKPKHAPQVDAAEPAQVSARVQPAE
jgi:hypothetical protein